ncbi:hypothetical protein AMJ50_02270 [Parcubacteria bacterium DG_74_3]|nr:MAG: hypothetical protein AMJ50_02270 [Parcubacteria bacterium DG_74_3]
MKFAIIGTGFIFRRHVQAIYKTGGKIVDVVDKSHGQDAWKDIVKETEADCIVVLAPNNLHFEMVKFSSDHGKIVLCEKPLAIKSEHARILAERPDIFTVYQLRHHPSTKQLKSEIQKDRDYEIELDISVHRDEDYWKSWKGSTERTGGILFNIGIHYFDLLLYLFGKPTKILTHSLTEKAGKGIIEGENYVCRWQMSVEEPRESQRRVFKINGASFDFSSKENLHIFVYQDLLRKKGATPKEAIPAIELIEKIYASYKK